MNAFYPTQRLVVTMGLLALAACSNSTTVSDMGVDAGPTDGTILRDMGPPADGGQGGVASIEITAPVTSVEVGSTLTLLAVPRNRAGGAVNAAVSWSSSDTGIATIDSNGIATGVAAGTADMTASANGITNFVTVTVVPVNNAPVASVQVQPTVTQVSVGQTAQVTAVLRDAQDNILAGRAVTWMSSTPDKFSIDANGRVTGIAEGSGAAIGTSEGVSGNAPVVVSGGPMMGDLTVQPSMTFQTMQAMEVTAQAGQFECRDFDRYGPEVLNRTVDEMGARRVRLEIRSSAENPRDIWREFTTGAISESQWSDLRYAIENDNGDPNSAANGRFHFSELDDTMTTAVLPMRQRIMGRGEQLYINLTYVDFGPSNFEHFNFPDEYAEFMVELFQHMDRTYGIVPDGLEVILEPDFAAGWSADQVGRALAAAGQRLAAAGYTPEFIGPSNTDTAAAVNFFDVIWNMPNVRPYLKELSYHRYSNDPPNVLRDIGSRGTQNNLRTSMLEHIGSGHRRMVEDMLLANVSAWSPFVIAFCIPDNTGLLFSIDTSNPGNPVITPGFEARYIGHYWRHMKLNAVRTGITGNGDMTPLAFRNPDGSWNVVVAKDSGGNFTIGGLPDGNYGVFYSTDTEYNVARPDVQITGGVPAQVGLPSRGVLTLYTK